MILFFLAGNYIFCSTNPSNITLSTIEQNSANNNNTNNTNNNQSGALEFTNQALQQLTAGGNSSTASTTFLLPSGNLSTANNQQANNSQPNAANNDSGTRYNVFTSLPNTSLTQSPLASGQLIYNALAGRVLYTSNGLGDNSVDRQNSTFVTNQLAGNSGNSVPTLITIDGSQVILSVSNGGGGNVNSQPVQTSTAGTLQLMSKPDNVRLNGNQRVSHS